MNGLRVCFFIPAFSDGGAQRQCLHLINELRLNRDIDLTVVTLRPGIHDSELPTDGITHRVLGHRSGFDPRSIFSLRRTLRASNADVLMTWLHSADVIGGCTAAIASKPVWIMTERDSKYPRQIRYKIRNLLGRRAQMIIANSAAGVRYWQLRGVRAPIRTAQNIVLPPPPANHRPSHAPRVLTVGRLVEQKNALLSAQSLAVFSSRTNESCAIVGDGPLRQAVEDLIGPSTTAARVQVLGFRKDARDLISSASALLNLSTHEGKPNVVLEAIAAGTIPVLSNIPEHRELVGANYPFLIPLESTPEQIADVILDALENTDEGVLSYALQRMRDSDPTAVATHYVSLFHEAKQYKRTRR